MTTWCTARFRRAGAKRFPRRRHAKIPGLGSRAQARGLARRLAGRPAASNSIRMSSSVRSSTDRPLSPAMRMPWPPDSDPPAATLLMRTLVDRAHGRAVAGPAPPHPHEDRRAQDPPHGVGQIATSSRAPSTVPQHEAPAALEHAARHGNDRLEPAVRLGPELDRPSAPGRLGRGGAAPVQGVEPHRSRSPGSRRWSAFSVEELAEPERAL